jgi:hypothetical protein
VGLGRGIRRNGALVGLLAAVWATGCGGGSDTYSASRFSECLQSRDASPTEMAADDSSSQQGSMRDRLADEARDQNGAVRAFTNTEAPNESSITVLFFRGTDEAQRAAQRVEDDVDAEAKRQRDQGLEPAEALHPRCGRRRSSWTSRPRRKAACWTSASIRARASRVGQRIPTVSRAES